MTQPATKVQIAAKKAYDRAFSAFLKNRNEATYAKMMHTQAVMEDAMNPDGMSAEALVSLAEEQVERNQLNWSEGR